MPVRRITITVVQDAYSVTCDDNMCKEWYRSYKLKRNADTAMLAHRMISHSYSQPSFVMGLMKERRNGTAKKMEVHTP
jgi:hypothetical protein